MITKKKINRAGFYFINKPSGLSQNEANAILMDFRFIHQHPMTLFRHTIERKLKKHKIDALVSQRLKRISSIIKKLKIHKKMHLSRMQDIGGLRIVVENIKEVTLIRDELIEVGKHSRSKFSFANEKDYIETPPESGYRSIHLVYKYDKTIPLKKQCRVEIQIRTRIQHSWATAIEVMGTFLNQPLKQNFGEQKYLDIFKDISKLFVSLEKRDIDYKFVQGIKKNIEDMELLKQLESFSIVTKHISNDSKGKYLLLIMDFKQEEIKIFQYGSANFDKANKYYLQIELENLNNKAVEVVLLSIQDVKKLNQSYPNYFMDTTEFIKNLTKVFEFVDKLEYIKNILGDINNEQLKAETSKMYEYVFTKTIEQSD